MGRRGSLVFLRKDPMPPPILIEIPAGREAVVRRLLALRDELDALALAAPDGTVLDACERQVLAGGRDLQRQLLTDAVARRIEAAEKGGAPISVRGCGRAEENRGPKDRQLVTAVGVIAVRRRYWQCRYGEPGGYVADAVVGLDGRYSRVVRTHLCRLAADTSFAATSEHLKAILDVRVSAETVRAVVEGHGAAMARFQPTDGATEAAFAKTPGEVEFAVDAGKVCTRQDGWKDLKIAVISKREAGGPATPDEWRERSLPAAGMVLAFAMIATAKTFRRSWRPRLRRLGVTAFAAVHAVGDGAAWIRKAVDRCLTGCRQTLDVYHACEHVAKCAERIFGEGTAAKGTAFERGRELLLATGWAGVCGWVGELLAVDDETERERRRPATERLMRYFAAHVGRLDYAGNLAAGRVIGSGAVEGQAKTLGLRLKRRGARWDRGNVRSMAALVCVRHSAQWNSYWASLAA